MSLWGAVEVVRATPQECLLNRTPEQLVDEPVPRIAEQAVRVTPHECVVNRTREQLVDEPVPQIAEEIVEGPVPLERTIAAKIITVTDRK